MNAAEARALLWRVAAIMDRALDAPAASAADLRPAVRQLTAAVHTLYRGTPSEAERDAFATFLRQARTSSEALKPAPHTPRNPCFPESVLLQGRRGDCTAPRALSSAPAAAA